MKTASRDDAPNRDRARVWWIVLSILALGTLLGGAAANVDMFGDPRTVVQAASDAVVVQPATVIDLVKLARPRFGLYDPSRIFDGIRLEPPASADTLFAGLGFTLDHVGPDRVILIQRFEVTPMCQLAIEQMIDQWIRIDVASLATDTLASPEQSCFMSAELLLNTPRSPDSLAVRHRAEVRIRPGRPATLQIRPARPIRLRAFAVRRLGFTTNESGSPESSIESAIVSLPDHGIPRDTVLLGDRLTLGALKGEVVEVHVNDGIRTLYKGTASDPRIDDRVLKPSLLEQGLYAREFRITVAIVAGVITLLMSILQVSMRD